MNSGQLYNFILFFFVNYQSSIMDPEYTKIITTSDYVLECRLVDASNLKLRACTKPNSVKTKVLEGIINMDMLKKSTLSDFTDLQQYLAEDAENHQIDWQQRQLKIVAVTSLRNKKTFLQLIKLQMEEIEEIEVMEASGLPWAVSLCSRPQDLSQSEIKQILATIIRQLNKVGEHSSNEVLDSIISKLGIMNQKSEYNQIRLTTQIEEIRQLVSKCQEQLQQQAQKYECSLETNKKLYQQLAKSIKQEFHRNKDNFELFSQLSERLSIQLNQKMNENKKQLKYKLDKFERFIESLKQQQDKLLNSIIDEEHLRLSPKKFEQQKLQKMQHSLEFIPKGRNFFSKLFAIPNEEKQKYKINEGKIERVGPDSQSSGVVGCYSIKQINKYKFNIVKTEAWGVSIGIKDTKKNEIIKYGGNGWISNCSNTIYSQGKGLSKGDNLILTVDTDKSEIRWEVENKQTKYSYETKCSNPKIAAKDRQWVLFITLSIGDIVEIL